MATVQSASVSPSSVTAHGGTAVIEPVVLDPARTFSGAIFDDQGGSVQVTVQVQAENLVFSVDPAKAGQQGFIVLVDQTPGGSVGSISVGADGTSFVFVSS
jgi:hypothetical protein